jgi:hypothetical protein
VHCFTARQVSQRLLQFLGMKSHLLADRERRRVVVDAESE